LNETVTSYRRLHTLGNEPRYGGSVFTPRSAIDYKGLPGGFKICPAPRSFRPCHDSCGSVKYKHLLQKLKRTKGRKSRAPTSYFSTLDLKFISVFQNPLHKQHTKNHDMTSRVSATLSQISKIATYQLRLKPPSSYCG